MSSSDANAAGDGSGGEWDVSMMRRGVVGPGDLLVGRYQLNDHVGAVRGGVAQLWRGRDTLLARDVAVSVFARHADPADVAWVEAVVAALLRWGQFVLPGCARVLDVAGVGHGPSRDGLPESVAVIAVTDWPAGVTLDAYLTDLAPSATSRGRTVAAGSRAATDSPRWRARRTGRPGRERPAPRVEPVTALRMVGQLVEAAHTAHQHGLVLGCAHPQMLRVAHAESGTPQIHLGFLLPDPAITAEDDVRGLGAVLYALLTGYWPRPAAETAPSGWPIGLPAPQPAGHDGSPGNPPAPDTLAPDIPRAVSDLVIAALDPPHPATDAQSAPAETGGMGIRTAAALHQHITQLLAHTDTHNALTHDPPDPLDPAPGGLSRLGFLPTDPVRPAVPRRPARVRPGGLITAASVVVLLGALTAGGVMWSHPHPAAHPQAASAGASPQPAPGPSGTPGGPTLGGPSTTPGAAPTAVATVTAAQVYDPTGQPDNATQIWRALGTDPRAGWSTDTYYQPFPALKTGIGIMLGFAHPVQLTSLSITSPSVGSDIQVRASPAPNSPLADTTELATATLRAGDTPIALPDSPPVQHVLLWISKLGGGGDDNVTEISNIRFQRATD